MGMITRVRGRLHSITKIDPQVKEEKIAETVCLLSVLFLLPYCGRGHAPLLLGLGGMWLATYSFLVLPVLISANYKYPVRWLRRLIQHSPAIGNRISWLLCSCLDLISTSINNFEHEYLKVPTVHTFLNQLLFFAMCDMVLGNNKTNLIGFTSLLFYYIITYFVQRIVDIVKRIKTPRTSQQYTFNSLAICIIKILLEWAKAVIAIICLKEQGLKPHPNVLYTAVTWFYYMSTEPLYSQAFPRVLKVFHLELFDGLETLYAPVILEGVAILTSLSLVSIVFCTNKIFAMVCLYHSVVLRFKHMRTTYWNSLQNERHFLNSCRVATALEIANWNDICAVCLSDMKTARITSCGHYFHGECLRNCLRTSNQCPLCKTELHISVSDE